MAQKRKWFALAGVGVILLCAAGSWFGLRFFGLDFDSRRLDRAYAKAEELGIPLKADDLSPMHREEPEIDERIKTIADQSEEVRKTLSERYPGQPIGPNRAWTVEHLRILNGAYKPITDYALANSKTPFNVERDFDLAEEMALSDLGRYREMASLLRARAIVSAFDGKPDETMRALSAMDETASFVARQPLLIANLVAGAIERTIDAAIHRLAEVWRDRPPYLISLSEFAKQRKTKTNLFRAARGEAYFQIAFLRNLGLRGGVRALDQRLPQRRSGPIDPKALLRSGKPYSLIERSALAEVLEYWNEFYEEFDENRNQEEMHQWFERKAEKLKPSMSVGALALKLWSPATRNSVDLFLSEPVNHRLTVALVDAVIFRNRNNRWPETVAEIGLTELDFDGQPFRIRHDGPVFRIYSVGPDRKDNGGVARSELSRNQAGSGYDLVAAIPAITPR